MSKDYKYKGVVKGSRRFVCHFFHARWSLWSLGISIDVRSPNIEIHIPFGFFIFGWKVSHIFEARDKAHREREKELKEAIKKYDKNRQNK